MKQFLHPKFLQLFYRHEETDEIKSITIKWEDVLRFEVGKITQSIRTKDNMLIQMDIESALPSGVYLTEEQEEQLFPSMPDYIVIDNTVYKPEVSEHLERYGRKVDGCSFYRVELIKVTDPEITDQILNTPEKMTEQLRERLEKNIQH